MIINFIVLEALNILTCLMNLAVGWMNPVSLDFPRKISKVYYLKEEFNWAWRGVGRAGPHFCALLDKTQVTILPKGFGFGSSIKDRKLHEEFFISFFFYF